MLGCSAEAVAAFLAKRDQGLDKMMIGDYLGEREEFNLKVGAGGGRGLGQLWGMWTWLGV